MPLDGFLELFGDEDGSDVVIPGESLDADFKKRGAKPIEILNFSLESQRDLAGDTSSEDPDEALFVFSITKEVDSATPQLFLAFCGDVTPSPQGFSTIGSARVTLRKAAGTTPLSYLVYFFKAVHVKTWKLDCKEGDELPEEEIEFTFAELLITYKPQTTQGAAGRDICMGWNFADNFPL
jgi:type VI secretion system secreted protein Hcp